MSLTKPERYIIIIGITISLVILSIGTSYYIAHKAPVINFNLQNKKPNT